MGCSKSSSKSKVYSNTTSRNKQTKKTSNNLTLYLKQPEKSKISRRKEIVMIKAETKEIETKTIIEKINEK